MNKISRGSQGEIAAARYLREKGYEILAANYTCRQGEIDIIAQKEEYIVFTEVKTRSVNSLFEGREAVGFSKQAKIVTTAMIYIAVNDVNLQPRFDVIEVVTKEKSAFQVVKINHIINAFDVGAGNASF